MKQIILIISFIAATLPVFAQFSDTAALNHYIKEKLRDRRPTKVSEIELQTTFLGITALLSPLSDEEDEEESEEDQILYIKDTITRAEAEELVEEGALIPSQLYCISDAASSLYGGTAIILKAVTNRRFSVDGLGYFYNPDYKNGSYTIWNGSLTEIAIDTMEGEFVIGESFYGLDDYWYLDAKWIKPGLVLHSDASYWYGPMPMNTPIEVRSNMNPKSATIRFLNMTEYAIGDTVIYGGKVWINLNGNRGTPYLDFYLNYDDWEELPYTSPVYVLAVDAIKYDWEHDLILGRREEKGNNEVYAKYMANSNWSANPIRFFQWGNPYSAETNTGIGNQRIINSVNNNINFNGSYQRNVVMKDLSYLRSPYCFEGSSQSNIQMTQQSLMDGFYLFGSSQNNISLNNSQLKDFCLTDASQNYVGMMDATAMNFYVEGAQSTISLWNREWDRKNTVIQQDENVFKFPFEMQKTAQTETRIMNQSYRTPDYAVPQYIYDLTFLLQDSMDYTFEYDLLIHNYMSGNTMLFDFNIPWIEDKYIQYTFHNLSTDEITNIISTSGTGSASMPVSAPGDFHVKITGYLKNPPPYNVAFIIENQTVHPNGFVVEKGSHAKYVRTPHRLPPDM